MNATTTMATARRVPGTELHRGIGLHGRVVVTWATAGGILLGGVLVALMTLTGRLSGHGLFYTASGLFVIGAVIGLAHGLALGFFGRTKGTDPRRAAGEMGRAAMYAIPALAVGWLVTIWVAMSMPALYLDRWLPLVGIGVAWAGALAFVAAATAYGFRALRNAWARWPQRRPGTALVAASFAALLVMFLADRPEIWGLRLRVTETGAVLLAAFVTFWVVGPAVTLALRLLDDLPLPATRKAFAPQAGAAVDVGLGLLVGLVLGVLAIPFLGVAVPAATGPAGAVVAAMSQALLDEVLLRVVLLTALVWVLLRWHRVHAQEAAVAAVALTALIQVALYAPGIAAIGFPTTMAALGFGLVTVALPAVAFGILYWTRGFGAALVADATAVAAVALLAVMMA